MPRPAGGLGRRVARTPRPASVRAWCADVSDVAAAPWPERVVGPLFARIFLENFVLKCPK
jgi:hypothetical protein